MGSPGCCKAPIQVTRSAVDLTVAGEPKGPVSANSLESGATQSGSHYLEWVIPGDPSVISLLPTSQICHHWHGIERGRVLPIVAKRSLSGE